MTIETIKRMLDACYQGKRIRDMLPPLPKGVTSSYIQYLDVIQSLERNGVHVKISDISDALNLPRRDPDCQGDGSGRLSPKENLAERRACYLHFHHRSGQDALTDV